MEIIKYGKREGSKQMRTFRCPVCGCIFKAYDSEYDTEVDGNFVFYHCRCPLCLNIAPVFDDREESNEDKSK